MTIRKASVAGQFYLAEPTALRAAVDGYITAAALEPVPDRVAAMVVPHAGHIYSGACAGHAFARARGKRPKRIVILGRSHYAHFERASVYTHGGFETPLGVMPIDEPLATALSAECASSPPDPHLMEHAIEVLLPFLQVNFGNVPIIPVLFGSDPGPWHVRIGEILASMLGESDLVVASTDLSHFLDEEHANRLDQASLSQVLRKHCGSLSEGIASGRCSMCGGTAVVVAMAYALARDARSWKLLDYRTSAAVTGDYSRVVGYGSISMEWEI